MNAKNARLTRRPGRRFRLTSLLAAIGGVAVLFSFGAYRRNVIIDEVLSLQAEGISIPGLDPATVGFWPIVPATAEFAFTEHLDGRVTIGGVIYSEEEANLRADRTLDRLGRLGVDEVRLIKGGRVTDEFVGTR